MVRNASDTYQWVLKMSELHSILNKVSDKEWGS